MADHQGDKSYDFIVVGSGPAGAALAYRLATSTAAPSVLLIEAGEAHQDPGILADRFTSMLDPRLNWGYKQLSHEPLVGQPRTYDRGKGVGGTSLINFAMYTIGPQDDYDEWARIVEDESFNWENTKTRYKRIENYNTNLAEEYRIYADPKPESHGQGGPLNIEIARHWERGFTETLEAISNTGIPINKDVNSGDPIGIGATPGTSRNGIRETASTSYLRKTPENLHIVTNTLVHKVQFDGKRAIGVRTGEKDYFALKEVVLSAGAVDTPKILLLSGIGPKGDLNELSIECINDLPVGRNLQDHALVPIIYKQRDGLNDRPSFFTNPAAIGEARKQFAIDRTGPMSVFYNNIVLGYLKSPELYDTEEFKDLPDDVKGHIKKRTVPSWELMTFFPALSPTSKKEETYATFITAIMNPQSRGYIKISSVDPRDDPICDPRLLTHPFDRRNMIQAMRKVVELAESPSIAKDITGTLHAPASKSDEDLWAYACMTAKTVWHPSSTVKMGRKDDPNACVDTSFRLRGMTNLRVVDLSVLPFLLNCHPSSVAYLVGEIAAEKIAVDHGLRWD